MKTVLITLLLILEIDKVATFAPTFVRVSQSSPQTTTKAFMVKERKKQHQQNDWITDWVADLQEWFETITHPEAKHKDEDEKKTAVKSDEWIAKELNDLGATTTTELDELVDDVVAPVGKKVEIAKEVVTSRDVERALDSDTESKTTPTPLPPKPKVQKTTYEWLTKDMTKAGRAELESKDWIAEDMKKAGRIGLHGDWVAEDMKEAGQAGVDHTPSLKKSSKKTKTDSDRIAEGMTQAGRGTSVGWIAQDMNEAGKAKEARETTAWTDKLRDQLDRQHEKDYDDVFKDMEKAGKEGAHSTDWVADDMTRAGKADSLMDKLTAATKDVTYKFDKWQKKRFDTDEIRKDMESAGQADARDWVAHDLEAVGTNKTVVGRSYPAPQKELREWLAQDEESSIAQDMEAEGRGLGNRRARKEKLTRDKLADLVAKDMQMVGKTSSDWVEADMERTGRADPHMNTELLTMSHKQRETEAFMSTRKAEVAPLQESEVKAVVGTAPVEEEAGAPPPVVVAKSIQEEKVELMPKTVALEEKPTEIKSAVAKEEPHATHHEFMHNLKRASKKVVMPWKKWKDLL